MIPREYRQTLARAPSYARASRVVETRPGSSLLRPGAAERQAPDVTAFCHRCERDTGTVYRLARSGHVLNACAECGTARLGRPYVPRHYLTDPEGPQTAAKGVHELTDR